MLGRGGATDRLGQSAQCGVAGTEDRHLAPLVLWISSSWDPSPGKRGSACLRLASVLADGYSRAQPASSPLDPGRILGWEVRTAGSPTFHLQGSDPACPGSTWGLPARPLSGLLGSLHTLL